MSERRSAKRLRTLLKGRVRLSYPLSVHECAVRDLSDTGVQIVFKYPVQMPLEIDFEIPAGNMSVRARLAWSDGLKHGLTFTGVSQAVENIAQAFFDAEGEGSSWADEPEIFKEEFRRLASEAIHLFDAQQAETQQVERQRAKAQAVA
ncbi:PilZ domain-containing protein [Microvirga soli]|uniref:PilZ domain-containing protein n=1 Tax=Microvirga soli TaxID=1854496 RepID=UPI00191DFB7F|nr:PilZ domain-containing protein [Microvirga soli]